MELQFKTDLNCGSCVGKVKPFLDAETSISNWSVDTKDPRKVLTVTGAALNHKIISDTVAKSGFHVLGPLTEDVQASVISTETYRPLIIIVLYLVGTISLIQLSRGGFDGSAAMNQFMGGFFLIFSFFKFLNLSAFADAYATYDLLAKRSRTYGIVYPFIELALGLAYVTGFNPFVTNGVTFVVMGFSTLGVVDALREKRTIQCACLGTVFNLPMTKVTLFEDLLMTAMALRMILNHSTSLL